MVTKRGTITVKGEVQRAGYRDVVQKIARKLDITGFIENMKPYNVRIICEGEKTQLKKFLKEINIQDDPLITIDDTTIKYEKPTNEFKYFKIKRGTYDEENAERLDLAAAHLKNLTKAVTTMNKNLSGNQKQMLGKQDQSIEKQDQMLGKQDQSITEIKGMRGDLKSYLDERFSKVEKEIVEIKAKVGLF